jgi:hypothetical protein
MGDASKGFATDALTTAETLLVTHGEKAADDYTALRLPPVGGMQMTALPDGSHALVQPMHLPKGTMTWQEQSNLMGPDGKPLVQLEPGDILAVEMRLVVRKAVMCETAEAPKVIIPGGFDAASD